MESNRFNSKIDFWLMALVFGSALFAIVLGLSLSSTEPVGSFIAIGVGIFVAVLAVLVMFPCRYELKERSLHIRCGLFRQDIPYSEIRTIELCSSPMSAPALSLQRVRVVSRSSTQLISPINRERFVELLGQRVRNAKVVR